MSDMQRPKNVIVTGSSGLIGSRLCEHLRPDHRVIGLDRDPPRGEACRPEEWIECDLTDDASTASAVGAALRRLDGPVASVVHLAAHYDFSGEPSRLYQDLTVEGTRRVLAALQGQAVEQFVFSSSLLVMRPVEAGELIDEGSPVEAEWAYPRSKLEAEDLLARERGSLPVVCLRIAGVYDGDCHSIPIAQQVRRIHERKFESYFFPGDPTHGQSFLHIEDLVACIRATIAARTRLGGHEVFLIGEPDVVSYGEMQDLIGSALHDRAWPTLRVPAPLAKVGAWIKDKAPGSDPFIKPWMVDLADAHMPVSIESAKRHLGWSPDHRLREELPMLARRLLEDPQRWYEVNGLEAPDDVGTVATTARDTDDTR